MKPNSMSLSNLILTDYSTPQIVAATESIGDYIFENTIQLGITSNEVRSSRQVMKSIVVSLLNEYYVIKKDILNFPSMWQRRLIDLEGALSKLKEFLVGNPEKWKNMQLNLRIVLSKVAELKEFSVSRQLMRAI